MPTWEGETRQQLATSGVLRTGAVAAVVILSLSAGTLGSSIVPSIRQTLDRDSTPVVKAQAPGVLPARGPSPAMHAAQVVRPRPVESRRQFVVIFGHFNGRAQADQQARMVRGKGYLASVVAVGSSFAVISRPYRSVDRAEFWAAIFQEIGLETSATARLRELSALPRRSQSPA